MLWTQARSLAFWCNLPGGWDQSRTFQFSLCRDVRGSSGRYPEQERGLQSLQTRLFAAFRMALGRRANSLAVGLTGMEQHAIYLPSRIFHVWEKRVSGYFLPS
jgi:hypothetical protein